MANKTPVPFSGFQEGLTLIRLPEAFFTELLPALDDPAQLRLLLYMFWHLEHQQGRVRYFRTTDLANDPTLVGMIGEIPVLELALAGLVQKGALLKAELAWMDETYYFINGPQGRAAVQAIETGEWQTPTEDQQPVQLAPVQPNIYKLYEENIGLITPMMAEILKTDEADYPLEWIEEAIRIAVARNARNWKYVQAILTRWRTEGRGNEQNRRDNSQSPEDDWKKWLKHG